MSDIKSLPTGKIDDEKINVLIMGVSGAGKSTLINAVIGEEVADVGDGLAVTKEMYPYESSDLPFRLIDTVGYEYGFIRQQKIKYQLKKWSTDAAKDKDVSKLIHTIWFCIDSQGKRIPPESLNYLLGISKFWKGVPIIIVFTKAYSEPDIKKNEEMFNNVMGGYKHKDQLNVKGIVSVVAKELSINEDNVVPSVGISELISKTNELIPESKKINDDRMVELQLKYKRLTCNAYIWVTVTGASAVGALPLKAVTDATIITPLQGLMIKKIADTYDVDPDVKKHALDAIAGASVQAIIGKKVASLLCDAMNVAGSIINAVVAGVITLVFGELTMIVFENIEKGNIDVNSVNWNKYIELVLNDLLPKYWTPLMEAIKNKDLNAIAKNAMSVIKEINKKANKK